MILIALLLAARVDPAPVTNMEYGGCADAKVCRPAAFEDPESASNFKTGKGENAALYKRRALPGLPAVGVSWNDAVTYCKWQKKRLTTEAEWLTLQEKPRDLYEWVADAYTAGSKKRVLRDRKHRKGDSPEQRAYWITFRCTRP